MAKDQDQEKHCITKLEHCSVLINDWINQNTQNELREDRVYIVQFPKTFTILHYESYKCMWRPSP